MKQSFVFLAFFLICLAVFAQDCVVEPALLKGTYAGDCKKGRASGKGKASGTDTYEGDFKSGKPEGRGVYSWPNGNVFTGQFIGGMKEGKGKLTYKRENAKDSIIEGYWKKDQYIGEYEHPYTIIHKSKAVTDVEIEYRQDAFNKITFYITNTSGGAQLADGKELPKIKVDEIQAIKGNFGRISFNETHVKKTETVIDDIGFPFRFKAIMGNEEIELEFRQTGSYIINLRIND
jgi:hypothetical protein